MPRTKKAATATALAAAAFTLADVRYDADTHTSWLPDGRQVPHVTSVLAGVGITDYEAVAAAGPRQAENIEYARERGKAVHADCHSYDDNDLDLDRVDPVLVPWVEAWIQARHDLGLFPIRRERRLFHPQYFYTGIEDGVFGRTGYGNIRILGDIKTGDPTDAGAHLQLAAYQKADELATGEKIDERWAIWLQPGARVPYRIVNYTARTDAWQDFQKWLACLTVYREQPKRRVKA